MHSDHVDVLIIGAGLSGIGMAAHLTRECPNKTYAILESRAAMGGTWDLFQYPGIRSDSDMYTFGYAFKPWKNTKAISDGASILQYIKDTADEYNIHPHIRYQHKAVQFNWNSQTAMWDIDVETESGLTRMTCRFMVSCSGYYSYEAGYTPDFTGRENFQGTFIHPQKWPKDLDYAGKNVVVIGSGATAVTLVPAMAKQAGHVTMLQRSPTYISALPEKDGIANALNKWLPDMLAYRLVRLKNVSLGLLFYKLCQRYPKAIKNLLTKMAKKQLGEIDIAHFTPSYNPWDERLCAIPDGDLFKILKDGQKASIVTDHIETFTENGILLKSGKHLSADIIVSATGLQLAFMGGAKIHVDSQVFDLASALTYKGMMLSDLPNCAFIVGYTNASWTLRSDLVSRYVCRLINAMDKRKMRQCTPRLTDPSIQRLPSMSFQSGYVQRALHLLPKQGNKAPWQLKQNYFFDFYNLSYTSIDKSMEFR